MEIDQMRRRSCSSKTNADPLLERRISASKQISIVVNTAVSMALPTRLYLRCGNANGSVDGCGGGAYRMVELEHLSCCVGVLMLFVLSERCTNVGEEQVLITN